MAKFTIEKVRGVSPSQTVGGFLQRDESWNAVDPSIWSRLGEHLS
jgi:hypothetical protein